MRSSLFPSIARRAAYVSIQLFPGRIGSSSYIQSFSRPRDYNSFVAHNTFSSQIHSRLTSTKSMKQIRLGNSDIMVSEVCLGTLSWGSQNTEEEAHEQITYAISRGINFIDTAEMYPTPTSHPNWKAGGTETIIGRYLAKYPEARKNLVVATKVTGFQPRSRIAAGRDPTRTYVDQDYPTARLDKASILEACNASLKRLQTDYIDLYQLHWPDRYNPSFGQRSYRLEYERKAVPIRETLLALKQLLDEGKIRSYGLSNESTFGVCEFVRIADEIGMPRPASIQNPFCLLDRAFESELAEACSPSHFNIALLPWSILAGGTLTGKYNGRVDENCNLLDPNDETIKKARFVLFKNYQDRFAEEHAREATAKYMKVASDAGISMATLAQAFCKSRWYVTSSIIGATTLTQLKENIDAFDVELDEKTLAAIDRVHNEDKDVVISA